MRSRRVARADGNNHQELPRAGDSHPRLSSTCARGLAWPLAGRRGTPLPPQYRSRSKERATKKMTMMCCYASPRSARTFSRKACCRAERSSPSMSTTIGSASRSGMSNSKQRLDLEQAGLRGRAHALITRPFDSPPCSFDFAFRLQILQSRTCTIVRARHVTNVGRIASRAS